MGVIAATALLLAAQGAGSEATPAGAWRVDDVEGECALVRSYRGPGGKIDLGMKPDVEGGGAELALATAGAHEGRVRTGRSRVTLDPGATGYAATWTSFPSLDGRLRGARVAVGPGFWPALAGATAISVDAGAGDRARLTLGPMAKPLEAFERCRAERLRGWGADPAALVRPASAEQAAGWFTTYPKAAWKDGAQGRTLMLLEVGRDGAPIACRTVRSAGDPRLDADTCAQAMRRARFAAGAEPKRYAVVPKRWSLRSGF